MADGRPAGGHAEPARRGPDRARVLRRDAVQRRAAGPSGDRRGARRRRRRAVERGPSGPARPPTPAGPGRARRSCRVPALGLVDRRRPRRQPERDGRDHRADAADPRRPRPARLRGGRDAPLQTIAASVGEASAGRVACRPGPTTRLARDAEMLPETDRRSSAPIPNEPYRQRFGFVAERLRRTRAYLTGQQAPLTGRYESADELDAELAEIQEALVADGLGRVAWGEVQDLRWQLATFGFHLASLEVRQHSAVRRRALAALRRDRAPPSRCARRRRRRGRGHVPGHRRAPGAVRRRRRSTATSSASPRRPTTSGPSSSSPRSAARREAGAAAVPLDVVPLFEDAARSSRPGRCSTRSCSRPEYRATSGRRRRQEVMLGYSDSNKESGLPRGELADPPRPGGARRGRPAPRDRADAVPRPRRRDRRGGGPASRAVLGLAPGSLAGRLKLTEQGEIVAEHYADPGSRTATWRR